MFGELSLLFTSKGQNLTEINIQPDWNHH